MVVHYFQKLVDLLKKHPELDPNIRNPMCDAPIHVMVKRKAFDDEHKAQKRDLLFNFLVYSKADVNAKAAGGMTALHLAAKVCRVKLFHKCRHL